MQVLVGNLPVLIEYYPQISPFVLAGEPLLDEIIDRHQALLAVDDSEPVAFEFIEEDLWYWQAKDE